MPALLRSFISPRRSAIRLLTALGIVGVLLVRSTPPPAASVNEPLLAFTCVIGTPSVGDADTDLLGGIMIIRPDGTGLRQITRFARTNYDFAEHGANFPDTHVFARWQTAGVHLEPGRPG